VNIERSAYSPVMSGLEIALRKIIAEVVREELQAILGHGCRAKNCTCKRRMGVLV
jgi:hypothetical protein